MKEEGEIEACILGVHIYTEANNNRSHFKQVERAYQHFRLLPDVHMSSLTQE